MDKERAVFKQSTLSDFKKWSSTALNVLNLSFTFNFTFNTENIIFQHYHQLYCDYKNGSHG